MTPCAKIKQRFTPHDAATEIEQTEKARHARLYNGWRFSESGRAGVNLRSVMRSLLFGAISEGDAAVADTTDSETVRSGKNSVQNVKDELGPFVVAADTTRMPMVFVNARSMQNEIVYANKSFLKLTGYRISDAMGLPFPYLIVASDRVRGRLENIANEEGSSLDLRCLRKDHTEFDASVLVSPVVDKAGELQQYFVSLADLTKHVEKRLQGYRQDLAIYKHTPGFIAFSAGPEHRFTYANEAYETLVGRADLVGKRVADVFPEIAGQGLLELLDEVYRSGQRFVGIKMPVRLTRGPNGEEETRYVDFVYEPVRDDAGTVVGLFCEGSDMTDGQATSEKLNDAQNQLMYVSRINAMGTMAATMAHELNQPLAAIANYASGCENLLEQSGMHGGKLQEGLLAIIAASNRAGKIISGLRAMTKRSAPSAELFDLGQALEESAHLVRVGGCDDVTIKIEHTPSVFVLGDKIQVQQVIINLLRNGCQAASESGRTGEVLASVTSDNGGPRVIISDNGLGFPAGVEDDIFKWTESSKNEGMGIGLSLSRTIAEAHGGRINIDKTGPLGSAVTFSLPSPTV